MDNPWEEVDYEFVPCDDCETEDVCMECGCQEEVDDE